MNSFQLGLTGKFTATSPFSINSNIIYTVTSLTLLTTLVENGENIFTTYYSPNSLTSTQYTNDLLNGVSLVTLESQSGPTVNILNTYISVVPSSINIPYSKLVVSVDLGNLPDSIYLDTFLANLKSLTDSSIGINSTVKLHSIPISTLYSPEQSTILETTRNLNIVDNTSFYTQLINANKIINALQTRIQLLQAALITERAKIVSLGGS